MVVLVEVRGRGLDHHVRTLLAWLRELREFLEGELEEPLELSFREEDVEHPILYVNGREAFRGLPGEEGYLIELVLSAARRSTDEEVALP